MHDAPRFASLVGLGFGDCGKGLFTDALCRRWPVHTVARFNGGAQAGHNVVLPDGRHHTFSQFGAGTFVPGVHTLLASPVVVHPTALLVEDEFLRRAGIADALTRLTIAAACRVTTPYHQAAGRLRERLRGAHAHGSCGVGVGETVAHAIAHPGEALRYADLAQPRRAREKLAAIRHALAAQFDCSALDGEEVRALRDDDLATRWLAQAQQLARQVAPADEAVVAARLQREGTLLFEGAQGVLLDESRGFHPHTTWSDVRPAAAEGVLAAAGVHAPVLRLGIVRAYATRHGAGPLPTHDAALDAHAEPHNGDAGWQGRFRRGHPDALLLRYAVEAAGPLDGLLVSHLDALDRGAPLRWCASYRAAPDDDAPLCERDAVDTARIVGLRLGRFADLSHQERLTRLLEQARPEYDAAPIASADALLERLAATAGCAVRFTSRGPTHAHVA
ncbi:MAG TPA: adenylosuccinate synthetase [Burkholderiaceae bacterium]